MATNEEIYNRFNDTALRNKIEASLVVASAAEIDRSGPQMTLALTLLDPTTAANEAARLQRYLVAANPDVIDPSDSAIDTAVQQVFAKMAGA